MIYGWVCWRKISMGLSQLSQASVSWGFVCFFKQSDRCHSQLGQYTLTHNSGEMAALIASGDRGECSCVPPPSDGTEAPSLYHCKTITSASCMRAHARLASRTWEISPVCHEWHLQTDTITYVWHIVANQTIEVRSRGFGYWYKPNPMAMHWKGGLVLFFSLLSRIRVRADRFSRLKRRHWHIGMANSAGRNRDIFFKRC